MKHSRQIFTIRMHWMNFFRSFFPTKIIPTILLNGGSISHCRVALISACTHINNAYRKYTRSVGNARNARNARNEVNTIVSPLNCFASPLLCVCVFVCLDFNTHYNKYTMCIIWAGIFIFSKKKSETIRPIEVRRTKWKPESNTLKKKTQAFNASGIDSRRVSFSSFLFLFYSFGARYTFHHALY